MVFLHHVPPQGLRILDTSDILFLGGESALLSLALFFSLLTGFQTRLTSSPRYPAGSIPTPLPVQFPTFPPSWFFWVFYPTFFETLPKFFSPPLSFLLSKARCPDPRQLDGSPFLLPFFPPHFFWTNCPLPPVQCCGVGPRSEAYFIRLPLLFGLLCSSPILCIWTSLPSFWYRFFTLQSSFPTPSSPPFFFRFNIFFAVSLSSFFQIWKVFLFYLSTHMQNLSFTFLLPSLFPYSTLYLFFSSKLP